MTFICRSDLVPITIFENTRTQYFDNLKSNCMREFCPMTRRLSVKFVNIKPCFLLHKLSLIETTTMYYLLIYKTLFDSRNWVTIHPFSYHTYPKR